ncbi:Uncharacterised protein [Halioglobus japonicus]|nr:Uncharacterised protein [Halioglobus japonicus]
MVDSTPYPMIQGQPLSGCIAKTLMHSIGERFIEGLRGYDMPLMVIECIRVHARFDAGGEAIL